MNTIKRFGREQRHEIDDLLKEAERVPTPQRATIISGLRRDYPDQLRDLGDDSLQPLIGLRRRSNELRMATGLKEPRILLEEMIHDRTHVPEAREKTEKARIRVDSFVLSRLAAAPAGVKAATMREAEDIVFLEFVEHMGGIERFLEAEANLTEYRQPHNRGLSGKGALHGYNANLQLFGDERLEFGIRDRLQKDKEVNILDVGCGECGAFEELVNWLSKEFRHGFKEFEEEGIKALDFGRGRRLRLFGVNRRGFKHPGYVNYIVGEIDDERTMEGLGGVGIDEIWDVLGAVSYTSRKLEIIKGVYYPRLKMHGVTSEPATVHALAAGLEFEKPIDEMDLGERTGGRISNMGHALTVKKTSDEFPLVFEKVEFGIDPSMTTGVIYSRYRLNEAT